MYAIRSYYDVVQVAELRRPLSLAEVDRHHPACRPRQNTLAQQLSLRPRLPQREGQPVLAGGDPEDDLLDLARLGKEGLPEADTGRRPGFARRGVVSISYNFV